jgi:hypothetical protein
MTAGLPAILRQREVNAMLDDAKLTRDWPDCQEKLDAASRQVRMALYKRVLHEISDEERDTILDILRPHCPEIFYSGPTGEPTANGLIESHPSALAEC